MGSVNDRDTDRSNLLTESVATVNKYFFTIQTRPKMNTVNSVSVITIPLKQKGVSHVLSSIRKIDSKALLTAGIDKYLLL